MDIVNKSHDRFFKENMEDIETAKDFIKNYLPKDLLKTIDLEKLEPQKDTYIDEELKEAFSDLLFKTGIKGKEAYIYFLFEHKSYLSNMTSLQLLKYMVRIWEQKTDKEKEKKLPIIIPLVIYHGDTKWNIPKTLFSIINNIDVIPETAKKYIPNYEYIVYDLSPYGNEEIKGDIKLRIFLEILRAVFIEDFDEFIEVLTGALTALAKLEQQEKGIDYFKTFMIYIMSAKKDLTIKHIYNVIKKISPERSDDIMTIAEQLIQEGMEKGREEGKLEVAKNALKEGAEIDLIAKLTGLSKKEIEKIARETE